MVFRLLAALRSPSISGPHCERLNLRTDKGLIHPHSTASKVRLTQSRAERRPYRQPQAEVRISNRSCARSLATSPSSTTTTRLPHPSQSSLTISNPNSVSRSQCSTTSRPPWDSARGARASFAPHSAQSNLRHHLEVLPSSLMSEDLQGSTWRFRSSFQVSPVGALHG